MAIGWQSQNQTGPSGSGATSSCAWDYVHLAIHQHTERGYHQTVGTQAQNASHLQEHAGSTKCTVANISGLQALPY